MQIPRTALAVLTVVALFWTGSAAAQTGPAPGPTATERARIELLLSAYEGFPKAGHFLKISDDPGAIMRDIAQDPDTKAHIRLGALSAMALFPDEKTWQFYLTEMDKGAGTPAPRAIHQVLGGLALGFGPRAVPVLARALRHADTQVRMTAAHALGTVGTDDARGAILEQADREKDPVVAKYLRDQVP
jgi:hypothetical protein